MSAPPDRPTGFTLVEVLAALAVVTLMLVLLLGLLDSTFRLWQDTEGRIEASREARAALAMMAADLQNAVVFSSSPEAAGIALNTVSLPAAAQTDTNIAGSLFFLRSLPAIAQAGNTRGDLCQVGYFVAYGPPHPKAKAGWNLYRYFQNSEATRQALTQSALFSFSHSGQVQEELLARHVTGLRLAAYATNTNGTLEPITPTAGVRPALLTVALTVVDSRTAVRFTAKSEWLDPESPLLQSAQQTFVTHLSFPP